MTADEEIQLVVETLHQMIDQLPTGHEEKLVPQIVPTRRELMVLVDHYLDKCREMTSVGRDGNNDQAALVDFYSWRASGFLAVLRLLFGDDEVDRLDTQHL